MLCHLARGKPGPLLFEALCSHWRDGLPPPWHLGCCSKVMFEHGSCPVQGMGPLRGQERIWAGASLLFTVHSRHLRFSALVLGPVLPQCLLGAWGPWAEAGTFPSKAIPSIYLRGVSASQQTCCKILQRPLFTEISTLTAYFWLSYSCTFPFSSKTAGDWTI